MVRAQEKSRQRLASEKMSPVQKLCQRLSSGAIRSELRTVQETMHMARALVEQMGQLGKEYGLCKTYGKDYSVAVAFLTPDLSVLNTWPFNLGKEAEMQTALSGPGRCTIPVGLVYEVMDPDGGRMMGARVFLNTPLVVMALKQRITNETVGIQ